MKYIIKHEKTSNSQYRSILHKANSQNYSVLNNYSNTAECEV